MANTSSTTIPDVGYLRSCMDRRFVAVTRGVFERLAGVKADAYYHEAFAGGSLGTLADLAASQTQLNPQPVPPAANGADYVYNRSFVNEKDINLVVMGWQVHLDHCGGLPNLSTDNQIIDAFRRLILAGTLQSKYPLVKNHIFLAEPPPTPPSPLPPDTTIVLDNTGGSYPARGRVFYRNPDGQLMLWISGQVAVGTTSQVVVPAGSTHIFIDGGVSASGGLSAPLPSSNPVVGNPAAVGDLPSTLVGTTITIGFGGTQSAPTLTVPSALM